MGKLTNLTVKGQVTIPKDVRDSLGLKPGEPVEIELRGPDEAVIRKPVRDPEAELEAIMRRIDEASGRLEHLRSGETTDEVMREIRGDEPYPP